MFNLIPPETLDVPEESLAVLSYGESFVPTPNFNSFQFRVNAVNAKHKLEQLANVQAKKLKGTTQNEA